MNNPCNECIVNSMCLEECPYLIDFIQDLIKSYNIDFLYNNITNINTLKRLARNIRKCLDTDKDFYYLCFNSNHKSFRLYKEYHYREIMKMRVSYDTM